MFTGCGTALVTPFRRDLSLDEETLRRLVRRQIDAGINFLVPCGTTGESPTLTRAEHLRVGRRVAPFPKKSDPARRYCALGAPRAAARADVAAFLGWLAEEAAHE